jgi:hypothetical protein
VAESVGQRLTAVDVGPDASLSGRRVWAAFGDPPASDDPAEEVSAGDLSVFACMLGGDDGRTLYLWVAPSFAEYERRETRQAQLLSCRVDVPHAGRP